MTGEPSREPSRRRDKYIQKKLAQLPEIKERIAYCKKLEARERVIEYRSDRWRSRQHKKAAEARLDDFKDWVREARRKLYGE